MSIDTINKAKNELRERAYVECFDSINHLIKELSLNEKNYFTYVLEQIEWLKKRYDYDQRQKKDSLIHIRIETTLEAFLNLVWFQEEMLKVDVKVPKEKIKAILKIDKKESKGMIKVIRGLQDLLNVRIEDVTRLFTKDDFLYVGVKVKRNGSIITKIKSTVKLNLIAELVEFQVLNTFLDNFYTAITNLYLNLENVDFKRFVKYNESYRKKKGYTFNLVKRDLSWANCAYAKFTNCDFEGANLSHANLTNTEWENVLMEKGNLWHANLQKGSFKNVDFTKSDLSNVNAEETEWIRTTLVRISCNEANFHKAKFQGVEFFEASLCKANFTNTVLKDTSFSKAKCTEADFAKANGKNIKFEQAELVNANLQNIKFVKADFTGIKGQGAVFVGATLITNHFNSADLIGANFSNSKLYSISLYQADCLETNFTEAKFLGVKNIFENANCQNANFFKTELAYIEFNYTNLTGAKFIETYFSKVNFKTVVINRKIFNEKQKSEIFNILKLNQCIFID